MIAVIFEVWPKPEHKQQYLDLAAELKPILETIDEAAVEAWRNVPQHRRTQAKGRATIFENYHLRIAGVIRDYGMNDRAQAPKDSRATHDAH